MTQSTKDPGLRLLAATALSTIFVLPEALIEILEAGPIHLQANLLPVIGLECKHNCRSTEGHSGCDAEESPRKKASSEPNLCSHGGWEATRG